MKNLLIICLLITAVLTSQAQEKKVEDCDCPKPTKDQFLEVCQCIFELEPALSPKFSYTYQEALWNISCANPQIDSFDVAKVKIQAMWNKYRVYFRCYNYPTSVATDKNITKFSMDSGFSAFLIEMVKKYNLDLNFKDPADQKTILDFLQDQESYILRTPPVDYPKATEYNRIYKFLSSKGAKHAKDL
jgi:hypothetical protein